MRKVTIIGGSGHVGTYLVPRLVAAGFSVTNVSRGDSKPYQSHPAWNNVTHVRLDRDAEEAAGTFGDKIAALGGDIVIDKICFTRASAEQLVEALRGRVDHFLHTGTIWSHGHSLTTPTQESDPRAPFGDYGVWKSDIEDYLVSEACRTGFPATIVRPGHIVGPGWAPLNPVGNFNPAAFDVILRGDTLDLPNIGLETVHHVHADDVAQMFMRAIAAPSASIGEAFNAVSPAAVTLRGYAEAIYRLLGHEPALTFHPFDEWKSGWAEADVSQTWEHISHSPCHSIEKARRHLGYTPRYTSLEAVEESLRWLIDAGMVKAG